MPKQYLIGLAIGPVQDFIAAARRTRDLWFGSYVLSEVSKAAALSFLESDSELIFPAPVTNLDANSMDNVGNKILVLVNTDKPQEILGAAKSAAQNRWQTLAAKSWEKLEKKKIEINQEIWDLQEPDVLEFFGAWVKLENRDDYSAQNKGRKRLDQLLNARKNTREFTPNPVEKGNAIAKSSLDGLRESVLLSHMKSWQKNTMGLSAGEELDCIGVVKRFGGDAEQFTPLSRLAIDPWLRNPDLDQNALSAVKEIMAVIEGSNLGLVSVVKGNTIYADFPFDGQLLYDFRIQAELDGLAKTDKEDNQKTREKKADVKPQLEFLAKKLSQSPFSDLPKPLPYMAILAADGDRMGELLDSMSSKQQHQDISAKLADFSTRVPAMVREFRGHCIYAGGDDVLAILPLDRAIACAQHLATDFYKTLATVQNVPSGKIPTLSVGLGVSHFLTPMGKQLTLARRAEQLAKSNDKPKGESKNALAILLQPRSGAEISFRERWDNENRPDVLLGHWIKAHNENLLPRRLGYELREASFALSWCKIPEHSPFIEQEVSRILERKRKKNGSLIDNDDISYLCKRAASIGLARLADELIISYRFAQVHQLSKQAAPGVKNDDLA